MQEIEMSPLARRRSPVLASATTMDNVEPIMPKLTPAQPSAKPAPKAAPEPRPTTEPLFAQISKLVMQQDFAGLQAYLAKTVVNSKRQLLQHILYINTKTHEQDSFWQFIRLTAHRPSVMDAAKNAKLNDFWASLLDGEHGIGDYHIAERHITTAPYIIVARAYLARDIQYQYNIACSLQDILKLIQAGYYKSAMESIREQYHPHLHPDLNLCDTALEICGNHGFLSPQSLSGKPFSSSQTAIASVLEAFCCDSLKSLPPLIQQKLQELQKSYAERASASIALSKKLGDLYPHELQMQQHLLPLLGTDLSEQQLQQVLETADTYFEESTKTLQEWGPSAICNRAFYCLFIATIIAKKRGASAVPPMQLPGNHLAANSDELTAWHQKQEAGNDIFRWLLFAYQEAVLLQHIHRHSRDFDKQTYNAHQSRDLEKLAPQAADDYEAVLLKGLCVDKSLPSIDALIDRIKQTGWLSEATLRGVVTDTRRRLEVA